MACANEEMLSVSATLACFNNGCRKQNDNIADKTFNSCSWTVWPTATHGFNIKLWPVKVFILGYLQWQMFMLPKAPREWRKGGLPTEKLMYYTRLVNSVVSHTSNELII